MNEKVKNVFEWIYCIIIAIALALTVRYFIGTPTIVKHTSMYPTFEPNDRLILDRLYRTFNKVPQRGEIITFEAPSLTRVDKVDYENFFSTEDKVLCFDDLERANVDVIDILGYINNFVEHDHIKTIIICNEKELATKLKSSNLEMKTFIATYLLE